MYFHSPPPPFPYSLLLNLFFFLFPIFFPFSFSCFFFLLLLPDPFIIYAPDQQEDNERNAYVWDFFGVCCPACVLSDEPGTEGGLSGWLFLF